MLLYEQAGPRVALHASLPDARTQPSGPAQPSPAQPSKQPCLAAARHMRPGAAASLLSVTVVLTWNRLYPELPPFPT